jgi:hypothetical protein
MRFDAISILFHDAYTKLRFKAIPSKEHLTQKRLGKARVFPQYISTGFIHGCADPNGF